MHTYRCEYFLRFLDGCYARPLEFLEEFDARRVVQGGGGVRSEERRKTSTVRQGGRTRAIR